MYFKQVLLIFLWSHIFHASTVCNLSTHLLATLVASVKMAEYIISTCWPHHSSFLLTKHCRKILMQSHSTTVLSTSAETKIFNF